MITRRAHSVARSAALAAVAATAVLSLAAYGAGDADAAGGPGKKISVSVTSAGGNTLASVGSASPVRTQTLVDGSKAKIYKRGEQHYVAQLVDEGAVYGTLEANGRDAGLDANDMFVVLTLDGKVHSWMGGGHTGPGTFKLAGGWTAKVAKTGELRYRAQILGRDGAVHGTLEANQRDAGLDANGVYIVLSAGGVISAHE
ncbi:hypothetical protein [Streptomyces sp. NPDC058308]|uniref:hypothetical protein n=1 Tax=Streptomyces sp. NPDC058308 TaxID=3346440 RepID=UPI0036E7B395